MQEQLRETIEKVNKVIYFLKTAKTIDEDQLKDIVAFLNDTIDNFFLNKSEIIVLLKKETIFKKTRVIDFEIKNSVATSSMIKTWHELIYLLKIAYSLWLKKAESFNFYIYSEVKFILLFYLKSSLNNKHFDSNDDSFQINEWQYHEQNQMYKYLFSIFDKLMYINKFITKKYGLEDQKEGTQYIFTKDFAKLSAELFRTRAAMERFTKYLNMLQSSSTFHYTRVLRNNIEHSFTDPKLKYNIATETMILYLIIMRTIVQINSDFKSDNEIYKLLNK